MQINRRRFLAGIAAVGGMRVAPQLGALVARKIAQRRVLTLVYDKAAGGMRAVEKLVPR